MPPATFLPMRMDGRVLAEPGGSTSSVTPPWDAGSCGDGTGGHRLRGGGGSLLSPPQCTGGFRLLKMQDAARSCNSPRA